MALVLDAGNRRNRVPGPGNPPSRASPATAPPMLSRRTGLQAPSGAIISSQ